MPGCFGGKGSFRVLWAGVEVGSGDRNGPGVLAQHRPGRVRAGFLSLQLFPAAAAAQFNHRGGPYVPDPGHSAVRGDQPAAAAVLDEGYRRGAGLTGAPSGGGQQVGRPGADSGLEQGGHYNIDRFPG